MAKLKDAIKNLGNAVNNKEPEGYYVTDMLKSFGTDLTGTQIEGKGITDVLNDIADNYTGGGGSATLIEKTITENGTYSASSDNADGYSSVTVEVEGSANLGDVTIIENGTFYASEDGYDGYNSVTIEVPTSGQLGSKTITANGTYDSMVDDGLDGYNSVTVEVPNNFQLFLNGFDSVRGGIFESSTSSDSDMETLMGGVSYGYLENMFAYSSVGTAPMFTVSGSNIVADGMFSNCSSLQTVPAYDMSHVVSATDMFDGCSSLLEINFVNMSVDFDISASTQFSQSDLLNIIENLADVSQGTPATLTMGTDNINKLTQDDIDLATTKGWTLA